MGQVFYNHDGLKPDLERSPLLVAQHTLRRLWGMDRFGTCLPSDEHDATVLWYGTNPSKFGEVALLLAYTDPPTRYENEVEAWFFGVTPWQETPDLDTYAADAQSWAPDIKEAFAALGSYLPAEHFTSAPPVDKVTIKS